MTTAATLLAASALLLPAMGALGAWRGSSERARDPILALIVTGQNNHNWRYTSRLHRETLEATGRFVVEVIDDPAATLGAGEQGFGAGLAGLGAGAGTVFVLDYNGPRWGDVAEANFSRAVREGAGVVVIHASNNAFPGWTDYERMCALMWVEGKTSHGKFHAFDVTYVDRSHPITAGLPDMQGHPDELYHNLVNARNTDFHLLARALSATESGGTGRDEPMALALNYGKGRVFHTPLGHVWTGQQGTKGAVSDLQFRVLLCRGAEWAATGAVTLGAEWRDVRRHNSLTPEEESAGWTLLFDGASPAKFRGYKQDAFPAKGWVVEAVDGAPALRHVAGQAGGDIITRDQYSDFEFACEWKVAPGGNSGIMYRVLEAENATYRTGPEMQVLDNAAHADGKNPKTSAGALYGLIAPQHDLVRPAGEWNSVRIVAKGNTIEHWINGLNAVEYSVADPGWTALLKGTKFESWPRFGREKSGHIALQDHGDDVWYRNIKVRAAK